MVRQEAEAEEPNGCVLAGLSQRTNETQIVRRLSKNLVPPVSAIQDVLGETIWAIAQGARHVADAEQVSCQLREKVAGTFRQ